MGGFELELVRPAWLAGFLAWLLLLAFYARSLVDFPRWQRRFSLVVRAVVLGLLVFALAGLTLVRPARDQFVVFAVDRSLSVGTEAAARAREFLAAAWRNAGRHRVGYLPFAAEPGALAEELPEESSPPAGDGPEPALLPGIGAEEPGRAGTNIESALKVAAASIPPSYVPRVVLISDGNETEGDALRAALGMPEVAISALPLPGRDEPEVQVSEVLAPTQVRQGEPFYVEVVVHSNHKDEGVLEVYRGSFKVASERYELEAGENRFRFRQSIDRDRMATFRVRIREFEDTLLDNNSHYSLVFAEGKPRILLVDSEMREARHLARALEREDLQVDLRPPEGMPERLGDLQNFELLILSNVPATSLSAEQMELTRTWVQDLGGGLMMIGGDQSFGLGGYYRTVLEEILPVRSDFEQEKEKPSLAMMLVIDKSGSMGGVKIELAKDAAKAAVELLGRRDQIGVLAFDGSPYRVSEVRPCSDRADILERISAIEAGGGTNMAPAMEEAYVALQQTVAKLKHVILMTDGRSAPGDFESIAASMAAARITVSTVALGSDADQQLMEQIADIGRGRYYFTDDPRQVPQIFAKETVTASRSGLKEEPFLVQVLRPSQAFAEVDFDTAPFLMGYVVTRPKATSEVMLGSETGDPILSWWRYGLGRVTAFTSDAKSRWAGEWLTWPGFSRFWAQVVRETMRRSEARGVTVDLTRRGRRAVASLDAIDADGRFRSGAETVATVLDPALKRSQVPLPQVAPGRYRGEFETVKPGAYHVELTQSQGGRVTFRQSRGVVVGYPDELRLRPTDEGLLRSLADLTGGRFRPEPEDVFAETDRSARRVTPLWSHLLRAALLLFVLDVALRRLDLGRRRAGTS